MPPEISPFFSSAIVRFANFAEAYEIAREKDLVIPSAFELMGTAQEIVAKNPELEHEDYLGSGTILAFMNGPKNVRNSRLLFNNNYTGNTSSFVIPYNLKSQNFFLVDSEAYTFGHGRPEVSMGAEWNFASKEPSVFRECKKDNYSSTRRWLYCGHIDEKIVSAISGDIDEAIRHRINFLDTNYVGPLFVGFGKDTGKLTTNLNPFGKYTFLLAKKSKALEDFIRNPEEKYIEIVMPDTIESYLFAKELAKVSLSKIKDFNNLTKLIELLESGQNEKKGRKTIVRIRMSKEEYEAIRGPAILELNEYLDALKGSSKQLSELVKAFQKLEPSK